MANISGFNKFSEQLLNVTKNSALNQSTQINDGTIDSGKQQGGKASFSDMLKDTIKEVNQTQKTADKLSTEVASGKSDNIQETMLAMTQAELSFNLMVPVRNKALEAYQEIMRMPF